MKFDTHKQLTNYCLDSRVHLSILCQKYYIYYAGKFGNDTSTLFFYYFIPQRLQYDPFDSIKYTRKIKRDTKLFFFFPNTIIWILTSDMGGHEITRNVKNKFKILHLQGNLSYTGESY